MTKDEELDIVMMHVTLHSALRIMRNAEASANQADKDAGSLRGTALHLKRELTRVNALLDALIAL